MKLTQWKDNDFPDLKMFKLFFDPTEEILKLHKILENSLLGLQLLCINLVFPFVIQKGLWFPNITSVHPVVEFRQQYKGNNRQISCSKLLSKWQREEIMGHLKLAGQQL